MNNIFFFEELECPFCENKYSSERKALTILSCGHNICKNCLSSKDDLICPFDSKPISDKNKCKLNTKLNKIISGIESDSEIFSLITNYNKLTEYCSTFSFVVEKLNVNSQMVNEKYKIFKKRIDDYNAIFTKKMNFNKNIYFVQSELNKINKTVLQIIADIDEKYEKWSNVVQTYIKEISEILENNKANEDDYDEMQALLLCEEEQIIEETQEMNIEIINKIEEISKFIITIQNIHFTPKKKKIIFDRKMSRNFTISNLKGKKAVKVKADDQLLLKNESSNFNPKDNIIPINPTSETYIFDINKQLELRKSRKSVHIERPQNKLKIITLDEPTVNSSQKNSVRRNSYKTTTSDSNVSYSPSKNTKDILGGISKDCVAFLKNQIKRESINTSGYNIGDKGCKALFQLKIKSKCENKNISCKELKMANCNITDNGMKYISAFIDMEGNSLKALNLSRNFISDASIGNIINILNKNINIREIKIGNNLLSNNAKNKIKDFGFLNGRKIIVDV